MTLKSPSRLRIAFTGHRPDKLGGYGQNELKDWLSQTIYNLLLEKLGQYEGLEVLSGCAQGTDQMAAFEAWRLRRDGLPVKLTMVLPFENFGERWPYMAQQHLKWLLDKADQVITLPGSGNYRVDLQTRNQYLVDYSDLLVAVYNGSEGGTWNTIRYAVKKERPYIWLNPLDRSQRLIKPVTHGAQLKMF